MFGCVYSEPSGSKSNQVVEEGNNLVSDVVGTLKVKGKLIISEMPEQDMYD